MKPISFKIIVVAFLLLNVFKVAGQERATKYVEEGRLDGNIYVSEEIGWTFEIPQGWNLVEMETIKQINGMGSSALEDIVGEEIDYSRMKNLIYLQKDQTNFFGSTSEPFTSNNQVDWDNNNADLKKIIYASFINIGYKVDSSMTTVERIGGLDFQKYSFVLYSQDGDLLLEQIMYSKLINGYDFGVVISGNKEEYRQELINAFRKSKFKKSKR